jgi:hypothetical protein
VGHCRYLRYAGHIDGAIVLGAAPVGALGSHGAGAPVAQMHARAATSVVG